MRSRLDELKDLGWSIGIWLLLLLLRPLIDASWSLKNTPIGFSPLQLVGAGLPAFFVWTLWKKRNRVHSLLKEKPEVIAWGVLLLLAAVAAVVIEPGSASLGVALKFVLPPLAIVFGYLYVRDEKVFTTAAWALLTAGGVPVLFLLYELIAGPMSTSIRGGVPRFIGPYAQVSVYGIHLSMMLMGMGYLAIRKGDRLHLVLLLATTAILGLSTAFLVHVSTWAVQLGMVILILAFLLRKRAWSRSAMLAGTAVLFVLAGFALRPEYTYRWVIMPDVEVLSSEAPAEQFMNSRGGIWEHHLADISRLPLHAQLLGSSLSGTNFFGATTFGAHNDLLRIFMATGVIGLLLYLFWLGRVIWRVLHMHAETRFLGLAALIVLLGYSVALTPTYIVPLVTVLLPVLGGLSGCTGSNDRLG
ncbi:MAG: hypothetical protein IH600_12710 [Bacteroidetes bacterium]|nr:hypothetical protein [Bacteroidota bacterium]